MKAFILTKLVATLAIIKTLEAMTINPRSEMTRTDPRKSSAIGAQQQQENGEWRVYAQFEGDGELETVESQKSVRNMVNAAIDRFKNRTEDCTVWFKQNPNNPPQNPNNTYNEANVFCQDYRSIRLWSYTFPDLGMHPNDKGFTMTCDNLTRIASDSLDHANQVNTHVYPQYYRNGYYLTTSFLGTDKDWGVDIAHLRYPCPDQNDPFMSVTIVPSGIYPDRPDSVRDWTFASPMPSPTPSFRPGVDPQVAKQPLAQVGGAVAIFQYLSNLIKAMSIGWSTDGRINI
ncbi:hypothetical protein AA313_de0201640 [Arthrobotrys entomopaga]|nr:hypothetical protein AA313_de0201640 [Arthrobotrys entomopaga]